MSYSSLKDCIKDLEKTGQLLRIKEEVDPHLEMAEIQRRMYQRGGPAILFEKVKGSPFSAVSNLFGTIERGQFIFRSSMDKVKRMVVVKTDPLSVLKAPFRNMDLAFTALKALPRKVSFSSCKFQETTIDQLPQIKCWPDDGGAFITLPQVFSLDPEKQGIMNSNVGMYRIQLSGNDYTPNQEIGLHYQIHRGIGVHQTKALKKGESLKVSIFVGGPPAHTLGAVMPLPEGLSELSFSGVLAGRRFRYAEKDGYILFADADFVITGEMDGGVKPEGPFGDHLGYYSLKHNFPVMKVHKVYCKKDAIWPFTVVGRPPQEDTTFGALIHDMVGKVIPSELPGVKEVHAVDESGVHPLLLAIGSERYAPYAKQRQAQELLTQANHILGTGQLSLAKYLFIVAEQDNPQLSAHDYKAFFTHLLERVNWERDLHFQTKTTIDTLDYSGTGLNEGSKLVVTAVGEPIRTLNYTYSSSKLKCAIVSKGILAVQTSDAIDKVKNNLAEIDPNGIPLVVLVDDLEFVIKDFSNFLWVCFTRSNPSHDVYGVEEFTENKHWGCKGSLIIDARLKSHHAPPLIEDEGISKKVNALFDRWGV